MGEEKTTAGNLIDIVTINSLMDYIKRLQERKAEPKKEEKKGSIIRLEISELEQEKET